MSADRLSEIGLSSFQTDPRLFSRQVFLRALILTIPTVLTPQVAFADADTFYRQLTNTEKDTLLSLIPDHLNWTQFIMENYFSSNLRQKYGYSLTPIDIQNVLEHRATTTLSPDYPYSITSNIQISSVSALYTAAQTHYDSQGNFQWVELKLRIPKRGETPYIIPELDGFVNHSSFKPAVISDNQMGEVLQTAFDCPPDTSYFEDIGAFSGIAGQIWRGTTFDGNNLRAEVYRNGSLILNYEPISNSQS